ncbi:MAG: glutathione S-transferase family protein [Acetobacteraceae bacterium]|nr:glutathione S-transferase family protein [Acetobacteraceae bacterium]
MRFYNSVGPNPRVVRMFMAERGIEIPRVEIDLRGGENRREPYLSKSPLGQMPALELDGGTVLTEITAICEYLDEITPGPSLLGQTPEQRAETRMWVRRTDLNIVEPMAQGYRYSNGLKLFQDRIHTIPQAADDLKQIARKHLAWLDGQMQGKQYLCGERFSFADVFLFPFLDFFPTVKQPLDPALNNIAAWIDRMKPRPSAAA